MLNRQSATPSSRSRRPAVVALVLGCICISTAANAQQGGLNDAQLRDRVKRAMQDGCGYLRRAQRGDGSYVQPGDRWAEHPIGLTALSVMALINCDVPVTAPEVQKGLEFLRRVPPGQPGKVYEASLMLMALCAAEEFDRDFTRIQILARKLEQSQVLRGSAAGLWAYDVSSPGAGGSPDHSNGQFAVLALRDAAYAGVRIDPDVWRRADRQWRDAQLGDGGWGYEPVGGSPKGSMTAAGLSTLTITQRMLQDDSDVKPGGVIDCCSPHPPPEAFERGRSWMGRNFTIAGNPGDNNWHFYYLYGMERAGRLSSVRFFGPHDWYRAGARYFVEAQMPDGHWQSRSQHEKDRIYSTSMALMFLSKGLSRVVVNKLDYTTVGNQQDVSGQWNQHPLDLPNLIEMLDSMKGWPPRLTSQVLTLSRLQEESAVLDMNQAPVLYISGRDAPRLSDDQVRWLREYVDEGGFIFAMTTCEGGTFEEGFRDIVKRMFPQGDASMQRLQPDHPVYRAEYPLDAETIELHGVDFGCRTAIMLSPEDHACLWQKWMKHDPPGRSRELLIRIARSTRVGANVLAYATGREPPEKLNDAMVRKNRRDQQIFRGLTSIAQLRHGGGWDTAPKALTNLLEGLNQSTGLTVSTRREAIPITIEELSRFPLAYMHGRYQFRLQPSETDALRDYLSRGALLFADSCCGSEKFDRSFRELVRELYPDHELKPIPPDHELFSSVIGGDIRETRRRRQVPGNAGASLKTQVESGPPLLEGIETDGRLAVIYSRYDISCALENQASLACDGYVEEDAMRLAVNIVLYALLQDAAWNPLSAAPTSQ